jgi:putative membrane protein
MSRFFKALECAMKITSVALFYSAIITSASLSLGGADGQAASAQDFVNKVAVSDMFEIQSSQLALSKNPDADTKPFADKTVIDHEKTSRAGTH